MHIVSEAGESRVMVDEAEQIALLDCPFCGDSAQMSDIQFWCVECTNCNATSDNFRSATEAATAWNLRDGAKPGPLAFDKEGCDR